jgi:hypothetical protein
MSNSKISDVETLKLQISQLKAQKKGDEVELHQSFSQLTQLVFNPASNNANGEHSKKHKTKRNIINLSKIILNMGTDFLIEQTFGKRQKWGTFATSVGLKLLSTPMIHNGIIKLFTEISETEPEDSNNI